MDYGISRFKETAWTTVFSLLFLGFVYILCFIDRSYVAIFGLCMTAFFALMSTRKRLPVINVQREEPAQEYREKGNRPYAHDRQLLNKLLRDNLRQAA